MNAPLRRSAPALTGTARCGGSLDELIERTRTGDVVVLDAPNIDRRSARRLVGAGASAIVCATAAVTGRFPTEGPLLLVDAGVEVFDDAGRGIFDRVVDGEPISIIGEHLLVGDRRVGTATRQSRERIAEQIEAARVVMNSQLDEFAQRTLELLREEHPFSNRMADVPEIATSLVDRHVLIVADGPGHDEDLMVLRRSGYLRNVEPVVIAVGRGLSALHRRGVRPDIVIGDLSPLTDKELRGVGEVIHHSGGDGAVSSGRPGVEGVATFESPMTSEDIAVLLAYEQGAELIVTVGTHTTLNDFLDEGQESMASTFMVRMRVAPVLVDAKGVSELYADRTRKRDLFAIVAAAMAVLVVLYLVSEPLRVVLRGFLLTLQ